MSIFFFFFTLNSIHRKNTVLNSSICIEGYGVFIAERPAWSVIVKTELFPS